MFTPHLLINQSDVRYPHLIGVHSQLFDFSVLYHMLPFESRITPNKLQVNLHSQTLWLETLKKICYLLCNATVTHYVYMCAAISKLKVKLIY